jgi:hypothetical protein
MTIAIAAAGHATGFEPGGWLDPGPDHLGECH